MNSTFFQDETFGNLDPSLQDTPSSSISSILTQIFFISAEIIKILICFTSALASSFLFYVLIKFKKLRRKTNIFLAHYSIVCFIDMLLVPLISIIIELSIHMGHNWDVMCIFYRFTESTCILIFLFGSALGVYWFIENYKQNWIQRLPKFYIYFPGFLYCLSFIKIGFYVLRCISTISFIRNQLIIICYVILLLIVISLNVTVKFLGINKSQEKTKYQFIVSNYIMFSYLPLCVTGFLLNFFWFLPLTIIFYVTEFFAYSSPIVVVYILGAKCKYFKAAYNQTFKKSVNNYSEEDMDEESESEITPNKQTQNNSEFINDSSYAIVI